MDPQGRVLEDSIKGVLLGDLCKGSFKKDASRDPFTGSLKGSSLFGGFRVGAGRFEALVLQGRKV